MPHLNQLAVVYLHLATVLPAFLIGSWLMLNHKGTPQHRALGKVFLVLMLLTAALALLLRSSHPLLLGHFGYLHLFVLLVGYSVPRAYFAARRGDIRRHRGNMIGLYVGALLLAGAFAFSPGRLLHRWFFG
jgi:uncharacterized membrane protein